MKARPRKIERQVAEHLNEQFALLGMQPVKRIPILGRTGPDITTNEARLVIDVKSRLEVPKLALPPEQVIYRFPNDLIAIRLENFGALLRRKTGEFAWDYRPLASKTVTGWYEHMDEWTQEEMTDGISALVLHKPRMPVGHSAIVISYRNYLIHFTGE
jgi:hypothetical protein